MDIVAGDLNNDPLKFLYKKLLNDTTDHIQIVNKQTHISRSLIDHVYIKETLMEVFHINVIVENIFFVL